MSKASNERRPSAPDRRWRTRRALPFAWLALSAVWAAVLVATDEPAWPLALWIATTVGPLTALERRRHHTGPGLG